MTDQKLLEVALQYIPHGVIFKCVDIPSGEYDFLPCTNISFATDEITIGNDDYGFDEMPLMCLRNINCLTKPITVPNYNDGKEFVPIVELAKNHIGWLDGDHSIEVVPHGPLSRQFNLQITWKHGTSIDAHFDDHLFIHINKPERNQQFVIDLMNQWLIDWRGLIDKGLAVEIKE